MITVLIVDDSLVVRRQLAHILESDPEIEVIGEAENGRAALEFLERERPHVVTMDIHMPVMNGLLATRLIMERDPLPIIIVTASWEPYEVSMTFKAVEAGALSLLEKPQGPGSPGSEESSRELITTVKMAAGVRVRRLRPRAIPVKTPPLPLEERRQIRIIGLGASTGGPPAIRDFLTSLPPTFSLPILVVQHMALGFMKGFTEWLNLSTPFSVELATHNQFIRGGHVYLAPEGFQMGIRFGGVITLTKDPPEHSIRPSVSYLFRSIARVYGKESVGILLTGMGVDGALELKGIRDSGGITFAQDRASSVIHGMPGEAIRLGACHHVQSPRGIALTLQTILDGKNNG